MALGRPGSIWATGAPSAAGLIQGRHAAQP